MFDRLDEIALLSEMAAAQRDERVAVARRGAEALSMTSVPFTRERAGDGGGAVLPAPDGGSG